MIQLTYYDLFFRHSNSPKNTPKTGDYFWMSTKNNQTNIKWSNPQVYKLYQSDAKRRGSCNGINILFSFVVLTKLTAYNDHYAGFDMSKYGFSSFPLHTGLSSHVRFRFIVPNKLTLFRITYLFYDYWQRNDKSIIQSDPVSRPTSWLYVK